MRITPAVRISLGLVSLTISLLLLGKLIGFAPDRTKSVIDSRTNLSEALAVQFSTAAQRGDFSLIRETLQSMVKRENDIKSAAMRNAKGDLIAEAGEHLVHWQPPPDGRSSPTHVQIPIFKDKNLWAMIEVSFTPLWVNNITTGFRNSYFSLILFVGCTGFAGYFLMMKRTLRELDPSAVVPGRVQAAFDVLKEGVLILDEKEQIVLANTSFAEILGTPPSKLIGFKGSELGWKDCNSLDFQKQLPWIQINNDKKSSVTARLILERRDKTAITFIVNAVPVLDGRGKPRGVLVTFDNITELEEKNEELSLTVNRLQTTTEEVQTKNMELEFLASHDPLTLLLNRRAFNRLLNKVFTEAQGNGKELSCIMCDIDHFKSVNDRYGHATGDKVIKMVAGVLQEKSRENDLAGRYGGEEFCIVLLNIDIKTATSIANRIRLAIQEDSSTGVQITMSFGISSLQQNPNEPAELINQADKALFIAKESGRNLIVCWGDDEVSPPNLSPQALPQAESVGGQDEVQQLTIRLRELEVLAEKRSQELKHYTAYDVLTGLPNRTLFYDRVTQALARGRRFNNIIALLSVSVDAVQRINETLGHKMGDLLFQEISKRLAETLRDVDTVAKLPSSSLLPTVSRLGQEDFGILLTDLQEVNAITWIVQRIMKLFERSFHIDGTEVYTAANIGVSIYPHDGNSPAVLEKNAVAARNHARDQLGLNRYYFYSDNINQVSIKHTVIESKLHRAIKNDEFILHYQPKLNALTGSIIGVEALIRWDDPDTGLVPPYQFIPIAEHSGLIGTIGDWVLDTACKQARLWLDMGIENCNVAVNFSAKQFRQKDLAAKVKEILKRYNLDPSHFTMEVTESLMMENMTTSIKVLREIRKLGASIALDDFGTGYSSLGYLKNFPLTHIKIDRSFMANVETNEKDATLIKSIIKMAHAMNLKVTAEGVETEGQVDLLKQFGCDELQGFLFSKPVPENKATPLLQNGRKKSSWRV